MRQISAVTGMRKKPRYRDVVEAEAAYMPERYALREQKKYRSSLLEAERDRLAKEEELTLKSLEEQSKQTKRAGAIGLGQLGITGYFGYQQNKALGAGAKAAKTGTQTATSAGPGFFSKAGITSKAGWGSAAKSFAPYAGGLTGALVGPKLGEEYIPFGGSTGKKVLGGALTGAGAGALFSGGNPYATAISAFIGGLGGLF